MKSTIVIESPPNTSHIRISSLKVCHLSSVDWMSLVNLPEFLFLKDLNPQKPAFLWLLKFLWTFIFAHGSINMYSENPVSVLPTCDHSLEVTQVLCGQLTLISPQRT